MDSSENEDELIIMNCSKIHRVRKKLLCKIPYFDRMLSHECLESKRSKVELDFDENALKSILNWVNLDSIMLKMDYIINLCNLADYFGMNDNFMKHCMAYFHANFTSRDIPDIIPQVSPTSKLVNSGALNAFICHNFKKIVKSSDWKHYPIEIVDYICELDLLIDSEMQVFDAIVSWVTCDTTSRKRYLKDLLNLVRWCHLKDEDLTEVNENELVKSSEFVAKRCSSDKEVCDCSWNRAKQNYFIVIEKLNGTDLRIRIIDSNFFPLTDQVIQLDKSLPLHFFHDEYVTDIAFDSGSQMIRIDWKQNKYIFIDIKFAKSVSWYWQIRTHIYEKSDSEAAKLIESCIINCKYFDDTDIISLKKGENQFEVIGFKHSGETNHWWMKIKSTEAHYKSDNKFMATTLGKNIFILTKYCELIKFDICKVGLEIINLLEFKEGLEFSNLLLTSSPAYEDSVILIEKISKEIFCYNFKTQEWSLIGRLINYNYAKTVGHERYAKLVAFTSTFLSLDAIRPCSKRKHDY